MTRQKASIFTAREPVVPQKAGALPRPAILAHAEAA